MGGFEKFEFSRLQMAYWKNWSLSFDQRFVWVNYRSSLCFISKIAYKFVNKLWKRLLNFDNLLVELGWSGFCLISFAYAWSAWWLVAGLAGSLLLDLEESVLWYFCLAALANMDLPGSYLVTLVVLRDRGDPRSFESLVSFEAPW